VDVDDQSGFRLISSESEDTLAYGYGQDTGASQSNYGGCSAADCDGCSCAACGGACYPRWTASADAMIMDRIGTKSQSIVNSYYRTREYLNSNDFHQGFYSGPRVGLIRHGDNCYDIEISYFQIDGWSSTRTITPSNDILEFDVPGYSITSTSDPMRFTYSSRLYNGEVNLRWNPACRVTMVAGFRWAQLREKLDGGLAATTYERFWDTNTENNLFGFQIGTETKFWERGCFSIGGIVKGGVYANHAEQRSTLDDSGSLLTAAASTNRTAFLGEVGLDAKYQVTKYLTLRTGYQVLWLEGVALAPGQLPMTNLSSGETGINTAGGVLYHGATAGFEYCF
jgi:hypothetical protein